MKLRKCHVCLRKTETTLTQRHIAAWLETQSLASSGVSDCTAATPFCPVSPPVKHRPPARWLPSSAPALPHQSSPGKASQHQDAGSRTIKKRMWTQRKAVIQVDHLATHHLKKRSIDQLIRHQVTILTSYLLHTDDLAHPDVQSGRGQLIVLSSSSTSSSCCLGTFSCSFWSHTHTQMTVSLHMKLADIPFYAKTAIFGLKWLKGCERGKTQWGRWVKYWLVFDGLG